MNIRKGRKRAEMLLMPSAPSEVTAIDPTMTMEECELAREYLALLSAFEDRTIALHQAIGMGQERVLPNIEHINRWREILGWEKIPTRMMKENA